MSEEVRRADAVLVRRVLLFVVAVVVTGGAAIMMFERYRGALLGWVATDPQPRARLLLGVVAAAAVAPLMIFSAYAWRIGVRTLRAGEFPPPGVRVVRDTVVVTGPPALTRGHLLRVLALACAAGAVALALLLWRLGSLFARP